MQPTVARERRTFSTAVRVPGGDTKRLSGSAPRRYISETVGVPERLHLRAPTDVALGADLHVHVPPERVLVYPYDGSEG